MSDLDERLSQAAQDATGWSASATVGVDVLRRRVVAARRRRAMGAAAVVVAVVGLAGTFVVSRGDRPDRRTGVVTDKSVDVPTTVAPSVVTVDGLPSEGIAVGTKDAVVLLDRDGTVLHRLYGFELGYPHWGPGNLKLTGPRGERFVLDAARGTLARSDDGQHIELAYAATLIEDGDVRIERNGELLFDLGASGFSISYDGDIVTDTGANVAFDVRSTRARSVPEDCRVADWHDDAWFLICDPDGGTFEETPVVVRLDADDSTTTVMLRPTVNETLAMRMVSAMVSPDGTSILVEATFECESPSVFLGSTDHADNRLVDDGRAIGWLSDGSALMDGAGCGFNKQIVRVRGGHSEPIFEFADDGYDSHAAIWSPPLSRT